MSTPVKKASLMSLPAEIRIKIWAYALFHHKTDGLIAPMGDCDRKSGHLLIEDNRYNLVELSHHSGGSFTSKGPEMDYSLSAQSKACAKRDFSRTATGRRRHFCHLECLVPPALTLVSSQVRSETLPVFYQVNRFHFELEHFECGQRTTLRKTARTLAD